MAATEWQQSRNVRLVDTNTGEVIAHIDVVEFLGEKQLTQQWGKFIANMQCSSLLGRLFIYKEQ